MRALRLCFCLVCVCVLCVCLHVCVSACMWVCYCCVRYSHEKSSVRRRTTTTITSQMLVALHISSYNTHACMYIHTRLHMHVSSTQCKVPTHIRIFLNNYKNCAVPSVVIVVSVASTESEWRLPSLFHPQDYAVHSCWRLFTPRERAVTESHAAKRACGCC